MGIYYDFSCLPLVVIYLCCATEPSTCSLIPVTPRPWPAFWVSSESTHSPRAKPHPQGLCHGPKQ